MISRTQEALSSQRPTSASRHRTVTIDGIPVFAGTEREAVAACLDLVDARGGATIATANLDFFALARRDGELRRHLTQSTLVIADGMPVVWMGKLAGAKGMQRLAGADLVRELFVSRGQAPLRVAIYGSTEAISAAATQTLEAGGDGGRIVHVCNPPFRAVSANEASENLAALVQSAPDVVLVALGCPAQERLIAEWAPSLPRTAWVGIGGTLDFYAGLRKRAPGAAQRVGLEWAVRLAQEPRRLARRYLARDLPALLAMAPGCVRSRWKH